MNSLLIDKSLDRLQCLTEDGVYAQYECRHDIWPGVNDEGQERAPLPDGDYTANAEPPGEDQGEAYGSFYIHTGDYRGRDLHGGGSDLTDPYAPRQGWEATYGCIRMQNEDGEAVSRFVLEHGNNLPLKVCS